jgi:hypothetical protein
MASTISDIVAYLQNPTPPYRPADARMPYPSKILAYALATFTTVDETNDFIKRTADQMASRFDLYGPITQYHRVTTDIKPHTDHAAPSDPVYDALNPRTRAVPGPLIRALYSAQSYTKPIDLTPFHWIPLMDFVTFFALDPSQFTVPISAPPTPHPACCIPDVYEFGGPVVDYSVLFTHSPHIAYNAFARIPIPVILSDLHKMGIISSYNTHAVPSSDRVFVLLRTLYHLAINAVHPNPSSLPAPTTEADTCDVFQCDPSPPDQFDGIPLSAPARKFISTYIRSSDQPIPTGPDVVLSINDDACCPLSAVPEDSVPLLYAIPYLFKTHLPACAAVNTRTHLGFWRTVARLIIHVADTTGTYKYLADKHPHLLPPFSVKIAASFSISPPPS